MHRFFALSLVVALLGAGSALAQDGHLKQINPADQARARAMLLRKSDLGASYYRYGRLKVIPDDEDSPNPFCTLSSPQLVVTGEASGPDFDWPTAYISSVGQVYATLDDADASWLFGTSAVGEKCTRDDIESAVRKAGGRLVSPFRRVAFPSLAQVSVAYRTVISVRGVRGYSDNVVLQHSRAHAWLAFYRLGAPVPRSERLRLARLVAARMTKAMSDDAVSGP